MVVTVNAGQSNNNSNKSQQSLSQSKYSVNIDPETSLDIHYDYKDASTTVVDKVMEVMEVMDTFTNTIDTLAPCTGTHIPYKEKRSGIESRIRV